MLVTTETGTLGLAQCPARTEAELQDVLRRAPNLLPVDDLGLDGPLMVVGGEAAARTWPHLDDHELDSFEATLARRLEDGQLHLVLAAQRITRNLRSTIEFLQHNDTTIRTKAIDGVEVPPHLLATHQDDIIAAIGELISGLDAAD